MLRNNIFKIVNGNAPSVATFICNISPNYKDEKDTLDKLKDGIGWYVSIDSIIRGWILCKEYKEHKTLEIQCYGYEKNGILYIADELRYLIEESQTWAKKRGLTSIRSIINSQGLSCHGKKIINCGVELLNLHNHNSKEFDLYKNLGFDICGILPEVYGEKEHGLILIKQLNLF